MRHSNYFKTWLAEIKSNFKEVFSPQKQFLKHKNKQNIKEKRNQKQAIFRFPVKLGITLWAWENYECE